MSLKDVYTIDETRNRILESALLLFEKQGLPDTQMMDVAKEANISRGSLYRYYRSKLDLALGVLDFAQSKNAELFYDMTKKLLEEDLCGLERLFKFFVYISRMDDNGQRDFVAQFDYFYSRLNVPKDFAHLVEPHLNSRWKQVLNSIIQEGKQDGSIDDTLDNHMLYVTIINSIFALSQRIIMRRDLLLELEDGDAVNVVELHAKLLFRGMAGKNVSKEFLEYIRS